MAPAHLYGFITDGAQIVAWCPACHAWHWHGVGGTPMAPGDLTHRTPHCMYHDGLVGRPDYTIEVVGNAPQSIMADARRKRPRGLPSALHVTTEAPRRQGKRSPQTYVTMGEALIAWLNYHQERHLT